MYKMIAMDMDGTLLNDNKEISYKTVEAIKLAKEKGIKIVLATGRPYSGITEYIEQLGLYSDKNYAVTFNGAMVVNNLGQNVVEETTLKFEDFKYLYELSNVLNVDIHITSYLFCIGVKVGKYSTLEADMNRIPFYTWNYEDLSCDIPIVKVLYTGQPSYINKVIKKIPKEVYEKYTVLRSSPYFIEFLHIKSNKGNGVKMLAQHLGVKNEEIMCIGDEENDIDMLRYAGKAIAMENASQKVKDIAHFITLSNNSNGIAHAINKLILEG